MKKVRQFTFSLPMGSAQARQCGIKVRYANKQAARERAGEMEGKTGYDFKTYRCRFCQQWHIAHSAQD